MPSSFFRVKKAKKKKLLALLDPEDEGTMILGNQWNKQHIIISQNTQVISDTTVRAADLTY